MAAPGLRLARDMPIAPVNNNSQRGDTTIRDRPADGAHAYVNAFSTTIDGLTFNTTWNISRQPSGAHPAALP